MLHEYRVADTGVVEQCVVGGEERASVVVLVEPERIKDRAQTGLASTSVLEALLSISQVTMLVCLRQDIAV